MKQFWILIAFLVYSSWTFGQGAGTTQRAVDPGPTDIPTALQPWKWVNTTSGTHFCYDGSVWNSCGSTSSDGNDFVSAHTIISGTSGDATRTLESTIPNQSNPNVVINVEDGDASPSNEIQGVQSGQLGNGNLSTGNVGSSSFLEWQFENGLYWSQGAGGLIRPRLGGELIENTLIETLTKDLDFRKITADDTLTLSVEEENSSGREAISMEATIVNGSTIDYADVGLDNRAYFYGDFSNNLTGLSGSALDFHFNEFEFFSRVQRDNGDQGFLQSTYSTLDANYTSASNPDVFTRLRLNGPNGAFWEHSESAGDLKGIYMDDGDLRIYAEEDLEIETANYIAGLTNRYDLIARRDNTGSEVEYFSLSDVLASVREEYTLETDNGGINVDESIFHYTGTSNSRTLPTPAQFFDGTFNDRSAVITIKNSRSTALNINTPSGQLIDRAPAPLVVGPDEAVDIYTDGVNYFVK